MREHNEYPEARLYEWVDPEERFVGMADAILVKQGVEITTPHPYAPKKLVAIWSSSNNEYTFRVVWTDKGDSGGQEYLLERYLPNGQPADRFFVKKWRNELKPFEKVDKDWRPIVLSEAEKQHEIRNALGILTKKNDKDATRIFGRSLLRRFPEVAATYVLSDLAVGPGKFINETAISEVLEAHDSQMTAFENLMGMIATKEDGSFDQELHNHLYHGAEPDGRNSYGDFHLRAVVNTVAKAVGASWQNVITPDHHDFIK